jgi:hypothetical protein
MDQKLYVIETPLVGLPKLVVWDLIEEREKCYLVRFRGHQKTLMKKAAGRVYLLSKERAVEALRDSYEVHRRWAEVEADRLTVVLASDEETILGFAKGLDSVHLAVDNKVVEENNRRGL